MWRTNENKGTSYNSGNRLVKKYHHPSGTPKIEIPQNSIYRNLDEIMNASGKPRDNTLDDDIFDTDIKYYFVNVSITPPEKKKLAL